MNGITIVEQLLDAVAQIKAWAVNLVQSISNVLAGSISQVEAKKVDKTDYDAFKASATANITDNTARITLLEEYTHGGIASNPWELYFDDLTSIVYSSAGNFIYNEPYERLEC